MSKSKDTITPKRQGGSRPASATICLTRTCRSRASSELTRTARIDRQPPTRALEGAAARLHREPLPQTFGRERPEVVVPIEERARQLRQQKAGRKAAKAKGRSDQSIPGDAV